MADSANTTILSKNGTPTRRSFLKAAPMAVGVGIIGASSIAAIAKQPMTTMERIEHHKQELYAAIREQAIEYEASGFVVLGGNAVLGNDPLWGGGMRISFNKEFMEPFGTGERPVERRVATLDIDGWAS